VSQAKETLQEFLPVFPDIFDSGREIFIVIVIVVVVVVVVVVVIVVRG